MPEQRPGARGGGWRRAEVRPLPAPARPGFGGSVAGGGRCAEPGERGTGLPPPGGERGAPSRGAAALGQQLWLLLPLTAPPPSRLRCPGGSHSGLSYRCLAGLLGYPKDKMCVVKVGN